MRYLSIICDIVLVSVKMSTDHHKSDVFLSHAWGSSQETHKKVDKINTALKARGITTWFDTDGKMQYQVAFTFSSFLEK